MLHGHTVWWRHIGTDIPQDHDFIPSGSEFTRGHLSSQSEFQKYSWVCHTSFDTQRLIFLYVSYSKFLATKGEWTIRRAFWRVENP